MIQVTSNGINYVDVSIEMPNGDNQQIELSIDQANLLRNQLNSALYDIKEQVIELQQKVNDIRLSY